MQPMLAHRPLWVGRVRGVADYILPQEMASALRSANRLRTLWDGRAPPSPVSPSKRRSTCKRGIMNGYRTVPPMFPNSIMYEQRAIMRLILTSPAETVTCPDGGQGLIKRLPGRE